jgi:hypothetical protein
MRIYSVLLFSIFATLAACQQDMPTSKEPVKPVADDSAKPISNDPLKIQDVAQPRFSLYKTQNMWTMLLLDTRTGRVWQAQYAVDKRH